MSIRHQNLSDWLFANGQNKSCLAQGRPVRLPHTWSVEEKGQEIVGAGWYKTMLSSDVCGKGERAFLYFHGAYRDTWVEVNDCFVREHKGAGYTPFWMEITDMLRSDRENEVVVRVDNSFSEKAVPCGPSFDWANDGGLYRPVELWTTGKSVLTGVKITAQPVLLPNGKRQHSGQAIFGFEATVDGAEAGDKLQWLLYRGAEDSVTSLENEPIQSGSLPCVKETALVPFLLSDIVYWHFDQPELYTLRLRVVTREGALSDERVWVIGFRELALHGSSWCLNGETVRLPGMEWMPGSDPAFGMAEPRENLEKMLRVLKESNSVLTRFHWQQDDWVYDWCDRHGLLVHEEIPFWGQQPQGDPEALWPVIRQQLDEMIGAHRHHPSIIAWGVGNELAAHTWPIQRYIRRAVAYAKGKDSTRLVNYVSNSAFGTPDHDGSGDGDVPMINDYIGTWHVGFEQNAAWQSLLDARPGRAFIPSEFGLCEPAFTGGDARREAIFLEKLAFYRNIPQIVGTVYFCLNDYRTHMGEEGEGRMKRRVHGSADLCGNPKPSYFTVQREYAPLTAKRTEKGLLLTCRKDIPSYSLCGYVLRSGQTSVSIPDLRPGESWLCEGMPESGAEILRPTGDSVQKIV